VAAMNAKARALGMQDAHFADPTGLSPQNRASARDLRTLLVAASAYPQIKDYTTETFEQVSVKGRRLNYVNSNPVVGRKGWDVLLSKTGFIQEAGRVVVVGFRAAGRNLAVVLMGADSSAQRTRDLVRVRDWVRNLARPKTTAERPAQRVTRTTVRKRK
jgi:D-alanyl-D-alanine endopeptidase (penicillin-binding protein 7)